MHVKNADAILHYLALIRPVIFISRILKSVKYVGELFTNCKILFKCNRVIKIFRRFMFIAIIMERPYEIVSLIDLNQKSISDDCKVHYFIINTIFRMYSK